jgi:hypothetical protein
MFESLHDWSGEAQNEGLMHRRHTVRLFIH